MCNRWYTLFWPRICIKRGPARLWINHQTGEHHNDVVVLLPCKHILLISMKDLSARIPLFVMSDYGSHNPKSLKYSFHVHALPWWDNSNVTLFPGRYSTVHHLCPLYCVFRPNIADIPFRNTSLESDPPILLKIWYPAVITSFRCGKEATCIGLARCSRTKNSFQWLRNGQHKISI